MPKLDEKDGQELEKKEEVKFGLSTKRRSSIPLLPDTLPEMQRQCDFLIIELAKDLDSDIGDLEFCLCIEDKKNLRAMEHASADERLEVEKEGHRLHFIHQYNLAMCDLLDEVMQLLEDPSELQNDSEEKQTKFSEKQSLELTTKFLTQLNNKLKSAETGDAKAPDHLIMRAHHYIAYHKAEEGLKLSLPREKEKRKEAENRLEKNVLAFKKEIEDLWEKGFQEIQDILKTDEKPIKDLKSIKLALQAQKAKMIEKEQEAKNEAGYHSTLGHARLKIKKLEEKYFTPKYKIPVPAEMPAHFGSSSDEKDEKEKKVALPPVPTSPGAAGSLDAPSPPSPTTTLSSSPASVGSVVPILTGEGSSVVATTPSSSLSSTRPEVKIPPSSSFSEEELITTPAASTRSSIRFTFSAPDGVTLLQKTGYERLLECQANLEVQDEKGNTAVHYVVGHIVRLSKSDLTLSPVDPKLKSAQKKLHLLLAFGAKCDKTNRLNQTIFDIGGPDPNWIDSVDEATGNTPAHWWAYHGHLKAFDRARTNCRANLKSQNKKGDTPWEISDRNGNTIFHHTYRAVAPDDEETKGGVDLSSPRGSRSISPMTPRPETSTSRRFTHANFAKYVEEEAKKRSHQYAIEKKEEKKRRKERKIVPTESKSLDEKKKTPPPAPLGSPLLTKNLEGKTPVELAAELKLKQQREFARLKQYEAKVEQAFAELCLYFYNQIDSSFGSMQEAFIEELSHINETKSQLIKLASKEVDEKTVTSKTNDILKGLKTRWQKTPGLNDWLETPVELLAVGSMINELKVEKLYVDPATLDREAKRPEPIRDSKDVLAHQWVRCGEIGHLRAWINGLDSKYGNEKEAAWVYHENKLKQTPSSMALVAAQESKKDADKFLLELNVRYSRRFMPVLSHLYSVIANMKLGSDDYTILNAKIQMVLDAVQQIAKGRDLLIVLQGLLAPTINGAINPILVIRDKWNPRHWWHKRGSKTAELFETMRQEVKEEKDKMAMEVKIFTPPNSPLPKKIGKEVASSPRIKVHADVNSSSSSPSMPVVS